VYGTRLGVERLSYKAHIKSATPSWTSGSVAHDVACYLGGAWTFWNPAEWEAPCQGCYTDLVEWKDAANPANAFL
jgi:hypothetical protein